MESCEGHTLQSRNGSLSRTHSKIIYLIYNKSIAPQKNQLPRFKDRTLGTSGQC